MVGWSGLGGRRRLAGWSGPRAIVGLSLWFGRAVASLFHSVNLHVVLEIILSLGSVVAVGAVVSDPLVD